ncbi:UvrD-helicase domain-containing protein [Streptomyces mirabilis]|uniref:UvrD-helicase domain-containing protein n=1 Tax=Streptomyces mirabilis TaxID=68239 RepID=UPI0032487C31
MKASDEQLAAAASESKNLLVVAPPGCGKTELLALRAVRQSALLKKHQRILALTFSNKARANLNERLIRAFGSHRYRKYVTVRNFHGLAAEIVRAHYRTIKLRSEFKMPERRTLDRALLAFSQDEEACAVAKETLAALKRFPLSDEEIESRLLSGGCDLALKVERDRISKNQLHYDDLLRHAQRLLRVDEVENLYRQHYGAALIDEFQDLSLQQLEMSVRVCGENRTFVGDPLQGIYSWAGAQPVEVEGYLRRKCSETLSLTVSFRSSPAVLDVVNKIATPMGGPILRASDDKDWPDGGASAAVSFAEATEESTWIAEISRSILSKDPLASIGVIVRSGYRRKIIDNAFSRMPYTPCSNWDLAIEGQGVIDILQQAVRFLPEGATLDEIERRVRSDLEQSDVDTNVDVLEALELLRFSDIPDGEIAVEISKLRPQPDNLTVGPGIHLLNAHKGKGQQFDWVIVPGLEKGHMPDFRSSTADEILEEKRALLVILSRARHGVVVTRADWHMSKRGNPYRRYASPWWDELQGAVTMTKRELEEHIQNLDSFVISS